MLTNHNQHVYLKKKTVYYIECFILVFSQSSVMESTGLDSYNMDPDWLDSFLEDPVLNDRMMSDALQPAQPISNEHSYSLANNDATDIDAIKNEPVDNGTQHHHDQNP